MGAKRSTAVDRRRCGGSRAAFVFVAVLGLLFAGCGRSGHVAAADSEKVADAEVVNDLLARELTAVEAYAKGTALLRGPSLALARQLRGQDQAYVDALTKSLRGLGGKTDAEAGELEPPGPRSRAEALSLAYEEENAALAGSLDAASRLQTSAARALAAALSAGHAQHLVLLRQALGVGPMASAPEPFEPGDLPPPATGGKGSPEATEGPGRAERPSEKG